MPLWTSKSMGVTGPLITKKRVFKTQGKRTGKEGRDTMNKHLKFALFLIVVALIVGAAWKYFFKGVVEEQRQYAGSDAKPVAERLKGAGDTYGGYVVLSSANFTKTMRTQGIGWEFATNDGGDYAARMKKFADGDYDVIVMPILSYLQHGAKYKYPGLITWVLSDSRGADAVTAFSPKLKTVNDLNDPSLSFVYVDGSPSESLLNVMIDNFGLDRLKGSKEWRQPVGDEKELLNRLRDRKGDVFITWEPKLSQAVKLGAHEIFGTEKLRGMLQDAVIVQRDVFQKRKQALTTMGNLYFRNLELYTSDRKRMIDDLGTLAGLEESLATQVMGKIHWYSRAENARDLFGVTEGGKDGVIDSIIDAQNVLVRLGVFDKAPLSDPYAIVSSEIIKEVMRSGDADGQAKPVDFGPLSDEQWKTLKPIGTLRIESISFQPGTELLDLAGKEQVDAVVKMLEHYPDCRVLIPGNTGPGDETENLRLSQTRAEVVMQYMITTDGVNPNRLRAEGRGSKNPLPLKPGETKDSRSYRYRLPRVEFVLLEGS